jgi:hypothetical protein
MLAVRQIHKLHVHEIGIAQLSTKHHTVCDRRVGVAHPTERRARLATHTDARVTTLQSFGARQVTRFAVAGFAARARAG